MQLAKMAGERGYDKHRKVMLQEGGKENIRDQISA